MQFKLIHYEMLKMNFGIRWLKTCLQSCQFSAVGIFGLPQTILPHKVRQNNHQC